MRNPKYGNHFTNRRQRFSLMRISASGYYFLSFSIGMTLFFLVWAILIEIDEPNPFVKSGILAGILMTASVIVRELFIKRAINRRLIDERRLEETLAAVPKRSVRPRKKLSIAKNRVLVDDLINRSKSASRLNENNGAHWEVFAACDKYLRMTREEISRTHIDSPRLGPINKSRGIIKGLHKKHLLEWARIETSGLSMDREFLQPTFAERIETAESVAESLGIALNHYPREKQLVDSLEAVKEYIGNVKISHNLDIADDAIEDRDYPYARKILKNVLGMLDEELVRPEERKRITSEIEVILRRIDNLTRDD